MLIVCFLLHRYLDAVFVSSYNNLKYSFIANCAIIEIAPYFVHHVTWGVCRGVTKQSHVIISFCINICTNLLICTICSLCK